MKRILYRLLWLLQIHRLLQFLLRKKTVILVYHGLTDQDTHGGIENYDAKHLHVRRFQAQMEYLKKFYRIVPLQEWLAARATGPALPQHAVVVTFDDGYRSNYELAFPILRRLGLPATIFLTTNFLKTRRYLWTDKVEYAVDHSQQDRLELSVQGEKFFSDLSGQDQRALCAARLKARLKQMPQHLQASTVESLEQALGQSLGTAAKVSSIYEPLEWSEIREMLESGLVTVGSHTHNHVILSQCDREAARQELALSKGIIEAETGLSCTLFCYPNGEEADFNTETRQLLQEAGYTCGLTSVEGLNDGTSDPWALKRVGVSNHANDIEFIMTLVGVKKWFADLKSGLLKFLGKKTERPLHGISNRP